MIKKYKMILSIILIISVLVVGSLIIFYAPRKPKDLTNTTNREFIYVSLGDSIADGTGLPDYYNKNYAGFVDGSYSEMLRQKLMINRNNFFAVNYAKAGLTSTDLLSMLVSDEDIIDDVKRANTISICIGANDILGPAQNGLLDFITKDQDITASLDGGIEAFSNNFPKIVERLQTLNPKANIIFLNIYNPYKEFIETTKNVSVSVVGFPTLNFKISSAKLNKIGEITEVYLNSGTVSDATIPDESKLIANGINKIISSNVEVKQNIYLLDVKKQFNEYYQNNNEYSVVKASALQNENISTTLQTMQKDVAALIDPHPTILGHRKIDELFTNAVVLQLTKNNWFII